MQPARPFVSTAAYIFIGILASLALFFWLAQPVLVPLIISASLCVILSPLMDALSRRGFQRSTASLLMLLVLTGIAAGIITIILPPFVDILSRANLILENVVKIVETLVNTVNAILVSYGLPHNSIDLDALLEKSQGVDLELISETSGSLMNILFTIVLVPILCFFLFRDFERFRNKSLQLLPNQYFELGCRLYFRVSDQLEEYVRHVVMQQCILGFNAALGFLIIGLPYPLLLGLLTAFCGLIPYLGPVLALLSPVLVIMTMPDANIFLLGSAVLVIAVVFLIDNVIVIPTLVAGSVDLHPLLVVVAVIVGGAVAGPIGMVLSIPAVASIKMLVVELVVGLQPLARRNLRGDAH